MPKNTQNGHTDPSEVCLGEETISGSYNHKLSTLACMSLKKKTPSKTRAEENISSPEVSHSEPQVDTFNPWQWAFHKTVDENSTTST